MQGRSVVVVAHRLTTVQRADTIGVVDHAELVEWGTHSELVQKNGKYTLLVNAWNASQPTR